MICKQCQEEGLKSAITAGPSRTTLMYCFPFYDEDGNRHHHDSNRITIDYLCSNGHKWTEKSMGTCWCGWPNKEKNNLTKEKTDD